MSDYYHAHARLSAAFDALETALGVARERKTIRYGSDEHVKLWGEFIKRTDPREAQLKAKIEALMQDMRRDILARLRARKGIEKADAPPFDKTKWVAIWRRALGPLMRLFVAEAGRDAADDLGIGISFDVGQPDVIAFMRAREERFAQPIGTLWDSVRDQIAQGIDAGESIPDIADRIDGWMGDRIRSSAETIARTEVIGATNGGTELSWKQSGVVKAKAWLSALDDRVRETHVEANGQQVGLNENFQVGEGEGPTPGQIGLPEEDINCRCTITAVTR